jgi:transcription elongation GreA/GreB family factor
LDEHAAEGVVGIGSQVRLRSAGLDDDLVLVDGTDEAAPQRLSVRTPLGRALLGRRLGDLVTVRTHARTVAFLIVAVDP